MLMQAAACRITRLRSAWCQASALRSQRTCMRTVWSGQSQADTACDSRRDEQRQIDEATQFRNHKAARRIRNNEDSIAPPFIDGVFQPHVLSEQEVILSRARAYGIRTIDELESETDLDSPAPRSSKLVNRPSLRQDLKLWRILLDHALLNSGSKGAQTIFNALVSEPAVKLVEDEFETTYIWQKLLDNAVELPPNRFLRYLCSEESIAWERPNLWAEVTGALVRAQGPKVATESIRALELAPRGPEDFSVLYDILRPSTDDQLKAFLHVCSQFPHTGLYQSMTSKLWQDGLPDLAFSMHEHLLLHQDLPRNYGEIEPFIKHLALKSTELEPFLKPLKSAGVHVPSTHPELAAFLKPLERVGVAFSVQAHDSFQTELARAANSTAQTSRSHPSSSSKGYRRPVHDSLVARAFAARGLSFDFVLAGLPVLKIKEIGPQALRELGLSSSDLGQLSERIRRLHESGIDTGASAFSRFVRFYLLQGNNSLVDAAIRSDMHVDVFEDTALQLDLLSQYCFHSDWPKVNLILAMLVAGRNQEAAQHKTRHLMLSARVEPFSHRNILKQLSHQDITLPPALSSSPPLLNRSTVSLLVDRSQEGTESLSTPARVAARHTFLFALLQELAILGQPIPVLLLRRSLLTMARWSTFDQTEAMILWIAQYCQDTKSPALAQNLSSETPQDTSLSKIFDIRFQTALLVYCVQRNFSVIKRKGNRNEKKAFLKQNLDWRKCLVLLKQLEQRYGVYVHVNHLCKAVRLLSADDPGARLLKQDNSTASTRLILERFSLISAHATLAGIKQLWPKAHVDASSLLHDPLSKFETRRKMNMLIPPRHLNRPQKSWNLGPNGWQPHNYMLRVWEDST